MPPKSKQIKKGPSASSLQAPSKQQTPPPAWPPLQLDRPSEDLSLHHLLPGQIFTVSDFWSVALCKRYVAFLSGLPLVTTPGVPKKGDAVRVNDRFQIDDPGFAETLWAETGLRDVVMNAELGEAVNLSGTREEQLKQFYGGELIGLNPNIRIYRYRKGQFFDQHYDDSNNLTFPGTPPTPARTTWTLLLYLTSSGSGCVGGETVFYPSSLSTSSKKSFSKQTSLDPITVSLETGMALLHKHGRDCMLHEGKEVLEGEKWVIRSDLCVKR